MNVFLTIVLAVQMLAALGMIGLILVQHGKGADMGAAFGSGGSGSLFGARTGLLRQPASGGGGQRAGSRRRAGRRSRRLGRRAHSGDHAGSGRGCERRCVACRDARVRRRADSHQVSPDLARAPAGTAGF
jgi:hypothetical protein